MSGVKRYDPNYAVISPADDLAVEAADGMFVMSSDYDACESRLHDVAVACANAEAERDELRAQLEAMRALMAEAVPALQHISDTAQDLESFTLAERFRLALQAKP